ncbi:hypothetical protein [uncultured Pseudoalteromonas sp.]|jgi:uncharacterized protein (TIGR02646 family)|uniref:hypothetical protein n=1 Tax=uncultured Pseudoalteromonas sp. TaxID=114053 RepID=UPI0030D90695|tara:strand:+ start:19204 stop:20073 length:870 start_codon:yes stop_codon:yes gene_type:complete
MRFIDFEGKTPVNTPANPSFPEWQPWSAVKWQTWLDKSQEHLDAIEVLHNNDDINARNKYIDSKSAHWGKLKIWLKVLSNGKCWFSEVRELYSHYDVEHFRPKKEAKNIDKVVRDGYWWLAFNYTNFRLCGNVGNRKKGGWFPLKDGSLCSTYAIQCEESEDACLLDPTDENDVNLIAFDETGNAIPAPKSSDWERLRVEQTIERLKLNEHADLAEARRKVWQRVCFEIEQYEISKTRCCQGGNPGARQKMKNHGQNIRNLTSNEAELSSVAKWCVFFREDAQLARLVA